MFKSKADTIKFLQNKKLKFVIPKTYVFSVKNWKKNKANVLKEVSNTFKKTIIIRSSALNEDREDKSNAGKYLSILNLNPKNKSAVSRAVNEIVKSYTSTLGSNKLIVQNQIKNVSMSGVIFSYDLNTGAPYYSINYDDYSGKTDTITSGKADYSNKKIYILRNGIKFIRSKRFQNLVKATSDLEKKIKNNYLDIEFAIDKNFKPYLFQVRKITSIKKWHNTSNKNIDNNLRYLRKKILNFLKPEKNIYGKKSVFGTMPDWNPVEMIGQNPDKLSYSLYDKLITSKSWATARKLMGYNYPKKTKLMVNFGGKPYIDARLSFNSFLLEKMNKRLAEKVVTYWLYNLEKKPYLYDKIEFEIAITCFSFDIRERIKNFLPKNLNQNQKEHFIDLYRKNFEQIIQHNHKSSINKSLEKISKLSLIQKNYKKKKIKKNEFYKILFDCQKLGVIPFAICARHAFIATTILDSLLSKKVIDKDFIRRFKLSLNTITSKFLEDTNKVGNKNLTKKKFMETYGHLRPGTYDIKSKRYDESNYIDFTKHNIIKKTNFKISSKVHKKVDQLLKKFNFENLSSHELFRYISEAIPAREYSKFVFTKSVSYILKIISVILNKRNFTLEDISNLDINDIFKNKSNQIQLIFKNKNDYETNKKIKLPEVIFDVAGTYIIPYQVNIPNFITNKKVRLKTLFLDQRNIKKLNFRNKIVIIENADPGYDWIFSKNIGGLITKFGGVNSHMAIRCAELSIPAAIGCGQKKYEDLRNSKIIELDCKSFNISYTK